MATTEVYKDYIKVTVKDILPRDIGLSKNSLKIHWLGILHNAFSKLDVQYQKVLCVIKIYNPAAFWDVDNRGYKIIIDSLRYNGIIPDDKWNNLAFMVDGEVDRENPRTEIYIMEYPENPLWFVSCDVNQNQ
ncbi:MAG: hypothetical protein PHT79_09770 [Syntrophomonadaceae bacterium]|nr:hypothetical protein [Syntrophomonadaceae bacterium]MDD4550029.1 hypothetical protein [Syntrophomonadaceae bacterium]